MSLEGKIAIITGGSKGIGKATAIKLHSQGAKIVVNYVRDSASADAFVATLGGPEHAVSIQADISKPAECKKIVDFTIEKYGKVDILINNASYFGVVPIAAITEEGLAKFLQTDIYGATFLMKYATPHMAPGSNIVNVSASATTPGSMGAEAGFGFYLGAKGAIEQISRSAAKEFGAKGINVNLVSPGPVNSDGFLSSNLPEARLNLMKQFTVKQRIGEPEDIADIISFLVSKEAGWIVGANIRANGGLII